MDIMMIDALQRAYDSKLSDFNAKVGQKQQLENMINDKHNKATLLKYNLSQEEEIRLVLQKTVETSRAYAKDKLEQTVTMALNYIFGTDVNCEIDIEEKAGKPWAEIYVTTNTPYGVIKTKPQDSRGGGIVDIVTIALRIAVIQLLGINGPILLDEPGKHVSADYGIKLAEFLKFISQSLGKQIIFVTHNEDLKSIADVSTEVIMVDGVSTLVSGDSEVTIDYNTI